MEVLKQLKRPQLITSLSLKQHLLLAEGQQCRFKLRDFKTVPNIRKTDVHKDGREFNEGESYFSKILNSSLFLQQYADFINIFSTFLKISFRNGGVPCKITYFVNVNEDLTLFCNVYFQCNILLAQLCDFPYPF